VHVVPADVGRLRATTDLVGRGHGVHVGPVGDGSAAVRTGEDPHHPVPADARGDGETGRAEALRHQRGGPLLLARRLGMAVDGTAQFDQSAVKPARHGVDRLAIGVRRPQRREGGSGNPGGGATEYGATADWIRHDFLPRRLVHPSLSRPATEGIEASRPSWHRASPTGPLRRKRHCPPWKLCSGRARWEANK
jgi:hypothetical protein